MKPLMSALIALFLVLAPLSKSFAETVAEYIVRAADPRNFSGDMLHPEAKLLSVSKAFAPSMERFFSSEQIAELQGQLAPMLHGIKVSNFEIQQETVVGDFVSVVYSLAYEFDLGTTTVSGVLRSLEILQKQGSSYRSVFAVQIE